jgi:glucose/arabinose dehydrogenase
MKNVSQLVQISLLLLLFNCSSQNNSPNDNNDTPDDPTPTQEATKTLINTLSIPWELVWGPDDYLWVTERNGRISKINPDTGEQQVLITINEVEQVQESGLLGMVLHPDFTNNPYIYVIYTFESSSNLLEKLVRYTYANNALTSPTVLLDNIPADNIHNGSRLLITEDLHLLMTTGDAGNSSSAQNMNSLAGKVLRLNLDGSIPADNPFTNSYVYSLGHRNAQGLTFHPNGKIYSSEHGPDTDDEINIIEPGKNYGWPSVRGIINTTSEQNFASTTPIEESIYEWTPTIATSDLVFYTGDNIPEWKNKLLLTTLKDQKIVALTLNANGEDVINEEVFFEDELGRLRDIVVSPSGRIFVAINGNSYGDTSNTHKIIEILKAE